LHRLKFIYRSVIAVVFTLNSCNNSIIQKENSTYFNIPNFIQQEAERLQTLDPLVTKTVSNEKSSESKQLKITNWKKELANFANIDVNKTGNDEFVKKRNGDTLTFETPNNSKNRVSIRIIFDNNIPKQISINKETKNLLFENKETFVYTVGKEYSIDKTQQVKGIGHNRYYIKGVIQNNL